MKKYVISLKKALLVILVTILIISIGIILGYFVGKLAKEKISNYLYKQRISELTSDSKEIERKWLIDPNNIKYDLSDAKVYEIEQTYINFSPEIRVRRVNGNQYSFTVKTNLTSDGLTRDETDFLISESEYNSLIVKKEGNTVYKTRYKLYDNGQVVCIDIFKGDLEGLAYMEIEFVSKEESDAYKTPSWVIKDVTDDIRYKNASLAQYGIPSGEKPSSQTEVPEESTQSSSSELIGL